MSTRQKQILKNQAIFTKLGLVSFPVNLRWNGKKKKATFPSSWKYNAIPKTKFITNQNAYAIRTGGEPGSNWSLIVVDVDVKNITLDWECFINILNTTTPETIDAFDQTLYIGHYYFKYKTENDGHPDGTLYINQTNIFTNTISEQIVISKKSEMKVDIRATNGIIFAPGSHYNKNGIEVEYNEGDQLTSEFSWNNIKIFPTEFMELSTKINSTNNLNNNTIIISKNNLA